MEQHTSRVFEVLCFKQCTAITPSYSRSSESTRQVRAKASLVFPMQVLSAISVKMAGQQSVECDRVAR